MRIFLYIWLVAVTAAACQQNAASEDERAGLAGVGENGGEAEGSAQIVGEVEVDDLDQFADEIDVSDYRTFQAQNTTGTNLRLTDASDPNADKVKVYRLTQSLIDDEYVFALEYTADLDANNRFNLQVKSGQQYVVVYKTLSALVPALAIDTVLPLILNAKSAIAVNLYFAAVRDKGPEFAQQQIDDSDAKFLDKLAEYLCQAAASGDDSFATLIDSFSDEVSDFTASNEKTTAEEAEAAADKAVSSELANSDTKLGSATQDALADAVVENKATTKSSTTTTNKAPKADAGVDQTVTVGATVTLAGGKSSDPDGDVISHTWKQTAGFIVSLSSTKGKSPTFTAPNVSSAVDLIFSLTVSDGVANSPADEVTITVLPAVNTAPIAKAGVDQTVTELTNVQLDGSGSSDPEGNSLTYSWREVSSVGIVFNDDAAEDPMFTAPDIGTNPVTITIGLTVSDGTNDSAEDTMTVTVNPVVVSNNAPVANAGPNQSVSSNNAVDLDGTGSSDPDDDTITYLWSQTSGQSVTLSDTSDPSPSFTAPVVASQEVLIFSLTVNDGTVDSTADTVNITINPLAGNSAPVANAGTDQTPAEQTTVFLDGSGSSDPDSDAITYLWTQTAGPSVTLSDNTYHSPTFDAPNILIDTTFTFSLVVNDGTDDSAPDTVDIVVQADPVSWTAPTLLESESGSVSASTIRTATNSGNELVVGWIQQDGMGNQVPWFRTHDGSTWSSVEMGASSGGYNTVSIDVAIDNEGDILVYYAEDYYAAYCTYYNGSSYAHQSISFDASETSAGTTRVVMDQTTGNALLSFRAGDMGYTYRTYEYTKSGNVFDGTSYAMESLSSPSNAHAASSLSMISAGSDTFHAVFAMETGGTPKTFINTWDGSAWGTPIELGDMGSPLLSKSSDTTYHLFGEGASNIESRYFSTNWKTMRPGASVNWSVTDVVSCPSGTSWMVAKNSGDNDYVVTEYTPGTNTWSSGTTLWTSDSGSTKPRIEVDSSCNPMVVYENDSGTDLLYRIYNGSTWSAEAAIATNVSPVNFELDITGDGRFVVSWVASNNLYYSFFQ